MKERSDTGHGYNKGKNGRFTIEDGHILPDRSAHQLPHLGVLAQISRGIQASKPLWSPVRLIGIILAYIHSTGLHITLLDLFTTS